MNGLSGEVPFRVAFALVAPPVAVIGRIPPVAQYICSAIMKAIASLILLGILGFIQAGIGTAQNLSVPTPEQLKAMVARLASSNKKPLAYPEPGWGEEAVYPKDYDKTAQKAVWQAYHDLYKAGPAAFPQLLDHVTDDRYSLTVDQGSGDANLNVGFLCRWILEKKISPFADKVAGEGYTRGLVAVGDQVIGPKGNAPPRPSFLDHLLRDKKKATEWMIKHQSYPLWEIQQEVLEWMIAQEERDTKTFELEERTFLKNLLLEIKDGRSYIESTRTFHAL